MSALPRRRNGKQQACEPCRKAKIACDHSLPSCDRCKRRKVAATKCIYLDAPMTRPSEERNRGSKLNLLTPVSGSFATGSPTALGLSVSPSFPSPSHEPSKSRPFIKSGGFFGPTNFASIYKENQAKLGNEDIQISNDLEPYINSNGSLQAQSFLMLGGDYHGGCSQRVTLGVNVLNALPNQSTCNFLLGWYFRKCDETAMHKPTIISWANSFFNLFEKQLEEPRSLDELGKISKLICRNNEVAAPEEFDSYQSWAAAFSGTNLRWETLGSIIGAMVNALLSLPERDAFFCTIGKKRKQFAMELKDCVQACITLSNYMDLINLQMVALLAKNMLLQTGLSGDTCLLVWRQLGDLVSASTALGLHREVDVDQPITFVSELRRRIFLIIFNMDKAASLLTGRPPALSFKYCKFKLPLDLSDEVVMDSGLMIKAVQQLDKNGWGTDGKTHPSTMTRMLGSLTIILNEILEFALSDEEGSASRIKFLLNQLENTYTSIPTILRWTSDLIHLQSMSDSEIFHRLLLRMHYLEYRLTLERRAHQLRFSNGQTMVDCAREMLQLVVLVWAQRDRFSEQHHNYDWLLMCWGVPSSGVLCVELLKQIQSPGTPGPILPRSEVVQNLSMLIGFLEWVKPAAGNYQLCGRMRQIIKSILDQILSPRVNSGAAQEVPGEQLLFGNTMPTSTEGFDTSMFDDGRSGEGLNNLDWLDSVDWSRGPFIDLGGQDYITRLA